MRPATLQDDPSVEAFSNIVETETLRSPNLLLENYPTFSNITQIVG